MPILKAMQLGRSLLLCNVFQPSLYSQAFVSATNLPDGWVDKIIGKGRLLFCLGYASKHNRSFGHVNNRLTLGSLPPDHPYIRLELEEMAEQLENEVCFYIGAVEGFTH